MPKPLPTAVLKPNSTKKDSTSSSGIVLGDKVTWNPETLPNGHAVVIGASGSGKVTL
ncbi:hypothetical protein IQ229_01090 [Nostoc cf. edaphicum LEGE 07299]|uniref:Uncharacterized protein n=1 Tax=Nostoc cf. edaphicum LEGE 07299 TaxID=2777974 RepID=A0ABR9TT55_9NOSO|nr:hypothetical protein [Nostoc edaphicum]MBE9103588.1 hypothetical protein [Nostoc cf. edaphicum LEGE 07299]